MIFDQTYSLADGVEIPKLGLGTWLIDNDDAAAAVQEAINIGYRNIDTAQAYGNEQGVGEGIRNSIAQGVPREKLFVSTKIDASVKDYEGALEAIDQSLNRLGLDYIDLLLIHSPQPWDSFREDGYAEGNVEVWRAMEEANLGGDVQSIGVSNFLPEDLENIMEYSTVEPQVNQFLVHVGNTATDLIEYCESKNILVQAHSPIGHGEILNNPEIAAMAQKYEVSVPQLCIRYTLQLGMVALPKSANPEHMHTNSQVDFKISASDMEILQSIEAKDYGDSSVFPVYNDSAL